MGWAIGQTVKVDRRPVPAPGVHVMSLTVKQLQALSPKGLSQFRAHEVPNQREVVNWQEPASARPKRIPRYKQRPGMSATHLTLLRALPCCITGQEPCRQAHHLRSMFGQSGAAAFSRGLGLKAEDRWALPLAHEPHMESHRVSSRDERGWFLERGIDPHALAKALWIATGNLDRMRRVLAAHIDERSKA
jgi:hypothetical protein